MKNIIGVALRLAVLATGLLCAAAASAQGWQQERLPTPVAQALRAAAIAPAHVALVVQEVGARLPRISHNADRSMNPASVMKLVTTYAALELLGPAYTWRTEVYADGTVDNGVLTGDLVLRGSGDPKLTLENFWLLLRRLRERGIRDIRGDLVLDRSLFAPLAHDPAAFDQEPLRPYNVGPDALLLNYKTVRLQFVPDGTKNIVTVTAEPHPPQLDLVNLLRLSDGPCHDWRADLRVDALPTAGGARLVLTGSYPAACGEHQRHFSLLEHGQYVLGVFRQLWEELGGRLQGGLREGPVPATAQLVTVAQSPALAEIVRDVNKFSNNVMARQLLLTLGAERVRQPAQPQDGELAVRAWLLDKGLSFPELVLDNGSGLSRAARISADSLARLLVAAYRSPVMPEFIASLPVVAVDGTMKKRVTDKSVAGHAHIKSGTLEGVRAIAGYVLDRRGRRQVVVFLVNHANAAAAQPAQDALLQCVFERAC
ncbi:MAG: D-alanyl-D-alanine carboxypeptidase/D-alanyl-D-alanine endopeptidase [Pseudomonadota bacterium]|jgi:D-alanyl-D-alanine carboxypeptidase/D-alanyl-D-alanine-endopeptidase (penicillin-binding protein 4)